MATIDCCTREIVAWQLELRCRAEEAIALIEHAAATYGMGLTPFCYRSLRPPPLPARSHPRTCSVFHRLF
jgi:hypothetical protein